MAQGYGYYLTSMMFVTPAAAPFLAQNNTSSIVNLGSLAGRKGVILTFARVLSIELGPKGTKLNAVTPGLIIGISFHNTHATKESVAKTISGIPIHRAGNAADVARAVLYLASAYDGFTTVATLDINRGVYNM